MIAAGPQPYRYERKMAVASVDPALVHAALRRHPALFRTVYPPRWINNVYLDTPLRSAFDDNVDGNPDRRKVRIRWYGDFIGRADPTLELKIKHGLVGRKERFRLPPFDGPARPTVGAVADLLARATELPATVQGLLRALEPSVANRYRRAYYLSADGRFRATVDTDITFLAVARLRGCPRPAVRQRGQVVVEVKYDPDADVDADRLLSALPFRATRNSKYADGVLLTTLR